MRKLSKKVPITLSMIAFSMPAFYLCHRIERSEQFNGVEFAGRFLTAVFFTVVVWAVYAALCLLTRKPKCPKCDGRRVAKYVYGVPKITAELERDVEAERIILGGVTYNKASAQWYCNDCQHEW